MKFLLKAIAAAVAAFVGLVILGAIVGPRHTDDREDLCRQLMQDSAPGADRRMTRDVCQRMGVKL